MNNNLEERVIIFSESVIKVCRKIGMDCINKPIISQLIRSATSVGANYFEANKSSSYKDFRNKIFICLKELNETKYWIIILGKMSNNQIVNLRIMYVECVELNKIFQSIANKLRIKQKKE
jgi:four helix bundle protein